MTMKRVSRGKLNTNYSKKQANYLQSQNYSIILKTYDEQVKQTKDFFDEN
jgi:stress response protein YsnF